jgi:hypothetical protein
MFADCFIRVQGCQITFLTSDVGNSKEIISWTGGGELMKTVKDSNRNSHVQISDASTQLLDLYNNGAKEVLSEKLISLI